MLKLTQHELATQIAVQVRDSYSRAALSQVENGDTKDMKPANLFAACKILGIDPQSAVAGKLKWVDSFLGQPAESASSLQIETAPALSGPDQLSREERELLGSFRCLTLRQRRDILQHVQDTGQSNREVVEEWNVRNGSRF
ncbi:helix-turn-helix transcriptional regulator [Candidatus Methylospira mobilis]|nr:helix-turn-helix transcriptional regulator [Candidatus Methylospira mobilis]WNV03966.1 helix-turn-helix transcriptional regulator [Candidatus Methylospira mobilis]